MPGTGPALRVLVWTTYTYNDPLGTIVLTSGDGLLFLLSVTSLTSVTDARGSHWLIRPQGTKCGAGEEKGGICVGDRLWQSAL